MMYFSSSAVRRTWHVACLIAGLAPYAAVHAALTLETAEQLALQADPAVLAGQARAQALDEQAVADGQLPDQKLFLSLRNVPLDDFSMKREGMSQAVAGIRQSFPRGRSLFYKQKRTQWLSSAESALVQNTVKTIQRDVREAFLELYYQEQADAIAAKTRGLF